MSADKDLAGKNQSMRDEVREDFLKKALFALFGICGWLLLAWRIEHPPEPVYFEAENGRITRLMPLNEQISSDAVTNWVAKAVSKSFNYDFQNFEDQFTEVRTNFTDDGWRTFKGAMEESKVVEYVVKSRLVSKGIVTGAPRLVDSKAIGGVWHWKFKIPMIISYQGGSEGVGREQPVNATVVVTRVPTTERPNGIAIRQLLVANR